MAEARERLKHGKSLCGKVFRMFVETFNWLVDFSSNLRGDGEQGGSGQLVLDRTDEKHPVIRCRGCKGEGGTASGLPQCFDIKTGDDETKLINCYYSIGGVTYGSAEMEIEINAGSIFALKVDMSSTPSAYIAEYQSVSALNQDQQNKQYYVRPLYWFDANSSVKLDFRNMPDLSPWEFE